MRILLALLFSLNASASFIDAAPPVNANGSWEVDLVDGSGNQRGTASNPIRIDPTGTTTQPVNTTQFGGTNISTGTGVGGAGIPRVTLSSDSSLAAHQSVNVDQIGGGAVDLGQENMANSFPVAIASDQGTLSGNSFVHVAGAATTTIKSGAGRLHAIAVNATGNSTTITVYNNTTATAPVIAVIGTTPGTQVYDIVFSTGLTIVTTNAGTDITVSYQ